MRRHMKSLRSRLNVIRMAHPTDSPGRYTLKNHIRRIYLYFRMPILADRGGFHHAPQNMRHHLGAITNSKNWNSQIKDFFLIAWGCLGINTVGSAGKNNSFRLHCFNFLKAHRIWFHFTIHITLPHAPGDELIILSAKIKNNHSLLFQRFLLLFLSCKI